MLTLKHLISMFTSLISVQPSTVHSYCCGEYFRWVHADDANRESRWKRITNINYMNVPNTDQSNINIYKQATTMRPRTPPSLPSRSRSRSPMRRHRSPPSRHRQSDSFYDYNRHSRHSRERPRESRCIGVFGLSDRTAETDIRRIFSKYGYIEDIILIMDNQTRRSRGYCFIYFETLKSAVQAVESSWDLRIDSRYVRVDYSITNRPNSKTNHERGSRDEYHRNMRNRNQSSSPPHYRNKRTDTNWKR